jgi:5-methylcytosine-specific restriction endonuclease McrA
MFDVLDDLEAVIDKLASDEGSVDVVRICKLTERLEAQRLRAVVGFDRSGVWAAERFLSPAAAIRHKTRCSHGKAMLSVRLARKLESLSLVAGAFEAGEITGEHVAEITGPYTPKRAAMLEGIESELVEFARDHSPLQLRAAVQRAVDAFDHDDGANRDKNQQELNKVTLSLTTGQRGILNGSLDAELADIVLTALDAEMEVLRTKCETRKTPELRSEALGSICRHYLASRGDSDARGRGQTHVSVVADLAMFEDEFPELVTVVRAETAHGGLLSRSTLERLTCDCRISRVITDGRSNVLDVGWTTRNVSNAQWEALVARDQHCQEPGCTLGPAFCEAHHIWHWEDGGPTNLANLKLLCWFCHRRQHIEDAQARAG